MSSIMVAIGPELSKLSALELENLPELSKLSALELENLPYLTWLTLASTHINQSTPNLVKMYITIRSQMSSIMKLIGPELEIFPYLTLFTLYHLQILTNQYQTWPQYKNYMPIRSQMSSIMGQIEPEHPKLFALEFRKIAESDCLHSTSSTNIDLSAPNLVKMYVIIRSWMSLIMDLIGPEWSKLSALELENLPYLTLFTLRHLQILTNQYKTWPPYICP